MTRSQGAAPINPEFNGCTGREQVSRLREDSESDFFHESAPLHALGTFCQLRLLLNIMIFLSVSHVQACILLFVMLIFYAT